MRTGIATIPLLDGKKNFSRFSGINNIPSEPKIPLKNYLLDLVAKSDGKESSIYLKGVEKFIQEIWDEMNRKNWRKLQVNELIPKELGISSIYKYKNGRKAISPQVLYKLILLWKTYCQKDDEFLKKKWDDIYKSNLSFSVHKGLQPTKLPKYLTPKLAYLMGFICGDGHLVDYGHHYLIKISEKSTNQFNFVLKPLFKKLFNVDTPIFQISEGGHALQTGNKPIFRFLTQVLKLKVGEIPESIKNLDRINKKYFLIGLFDSEGNVSSSYLERKIVINQGNYKFLKGVIDLFKDLDTRFTGPYRHQTKLGIWYHIQIKKKADILKFIKEIGTCHIDKFQKIKILEKELYAHGYRHNST